MKLVHGLAACLFGLTLPHAASAQDLPFSPEATLSCLEAEGRESCIGLSAQACIDTPDGYTTVGMDFCFGKERDLWDDRLNGSYQRLRLAERGVDDKMKEIGATVPEMAPALRNMQRAWIAYRDALCDYERAQWGGGSGQGPATAACLMRETARQTLILEARLIEYEGR